MAEETIEDCKRLLEQEKKKVHVLEQKVQSFEIAGKVRMYYALNRNLNDLADMLNSIELKNVAIEDPKDKTMERLKLIWGAIASLSTTVQVMGESAGITGNEAEDSKRKVSFIDSIADKRY
jgi:hypothetical protein